MKRLGEFLVRRRRTVVIVALVGLALAGAYGGSVVDSLSNGGFEDPGSESFLAAQTLEERFGVEDPAMVLVVTAVDGTVDDPAVAEAGLALTAELLAQPGVTGASSYWALGSPASLRSDDASRALVFVTVAGDQGEVLVRSGELAEEYRGERGPIDVLVGGVGPLFSEVQETIESDLARAEIISFPVTLVLMILVFGSVVAALLPLTIGVFAIISTLAVLQFLAGQTEVSIFALNLTTAMGLGLAIDYSLFVVSRFREELASGFEPGEAVVRTVRTAGRTVVFSAGTVAASLSAMLVFDLAFLRSFGYAGIAVVGMAAVGAVVVLPAVLALLGRRIDTWRIRKPRQVGVGDGIWHRIATAVMRRPIPVATAALALLVVLGMPFFGVEFGTNDDRILGDGAYAREVGDVLRTEFGAAESAPITVVSTEVAEPAALGAYAAALSALDGVARVDAATGSYVAGTQVMPATPAHARFLGDGTDLSIITAVDPVSAEAERLVADVRALTAPVPTAVSGQSAGFVDTKASLFGSMPWALLIIGAVTFLLLFLQFGSLVVPAKAVLLNIASLSATFGALVWVFQDGNLSGFLGFTSTGTLDLSMPILIFVIAFGLSMDYEVFLLSRIKEEYDRTGDNEHSVAAGLERTGRIVTAAAVLIAVVFIAFATSQVVVIKMFGIGMTLAVLVDAFIVRATLVPAFMRLAGAINWWAPVWMKRLYQRFGISDHVVLDGPDRTMGGVLEEV